MEKIEEPKVGSRGFTYTAFDVLNNKTDKVVKYPYVKGLDNVDCEDNAIKDQMKLTGLPRSTFMIYGLHK